MYTILYIGKLCGDKLTIADQAAIRNCINEFVVRGLLPSCERRMKELNEVIISSN